MYNRREFLFQATIVAILPRGLKLFYQETGPMISAGFDQNELRLLQAIMDLIVPAGDGKPAVTSVGGVEYLQLIGRKSSSVQEELRNFLTELDRASHMMFRAPFEQLPRERRVHLVSKLEKHSPPKLFRFIGYVYEAYYTQPRVLALIACESRLTSPPEQDDEMLLSAVRKMRLKYREVD